MWIFIIAVVLLAVVIAVTAKRPHRPPLTREEQVLRINHLRARPVYDPVIENARNHVHGIADV